MRVRFLTFVSCCLLLGACSRAAAAPSGDASTLVVGYSALRISLPVFVAKERGLFRRHGLRVRLKRYETAQPLVEEVLDGRVLAGGYAALPIVFTAASRDGSRVRLTTALVEDRARPVSYLLRPKSRHDLRSAADLRGARIGILPTVAYQKWLGAILRHAGVRPDEVTVMPIAPPEQVQALAHGGIDALFTNDPMATAALAAGVAAPLGTKAPVPDALGGPLLFGSFLVHPRLVRERPDVVRALEAALDDAIAVIDADPDAARRAMLPFVRPTERPFVDRYPPARYLGSDALTADRLTAEVQSERRLGMLSSQVDVHGWALGEHARAEAAR